MTQTILLIPQRLIQRAAVIQLCIFQLNKVSVINWKKEKSSNHFGNCGKRYEILWIVSRTVERRTGHRIGSKRGPPASKALGKFFGPCPFLLDHALMFTGKALLLDGNALLYTVASTSFDGKSFYLVCKDKV